MTMREILFRGKDNGVLNNQWQIGSIDFAKNPEFPNIIRCDRFGNEMFITVDLETVGQFTGLTDMNGKKIFEGDIVQAHFRNNHSKQKFRVVFDDGMFLFDNKHVKVPKYEIYAMKVIGNIHDNLELLGVAADD